MPRTKKIAKVDPSMTPDQIIESLETLLATIKLEVQEAERLVLAHQERSFDDSLPDWCVLDIRWLVTKLTDVLVYSSFYTR